MARNRYPKQGKRTTASGGAGRTARNKNKPGGEVLRSPEKYVAIHLRRPQGASSMGTRWYGRMTSRSAASAGEWARSCPKSTAWQRSGVQSVVERRVVVTFRRPPRVRLSLSPSHARLARRSAGRPPRPEPRGTGSPFSDAFARAINQPRERTRTRRAIDSPCVGSVAAAAGCRCKNERRVRRDDVATSRSRCREPSIRRRRRR